MIKKTLLITIILTFLLINLVSATHECTLNITSCSQPVINNEYVCLQNDVECIGNLEIGNNTVFDGQGFTMNTTVASAQAIRTTAESTNITIKNTNFLNEYGVSIGTNVTDITIDNNTFENTNCLSISTSNQQNIRITNNVFNDYVLSSSCITISGVNDVLIQNNSATNFELSNTHFVAITTSSSSDIIIDNNNFDNFLSTMFDVNVAGSDNITISNNNATTFYNGFIDLFSPVTNLTINDNNVIRVGNMSCLGDCDSDPQVVNSSGTFNNFKRAIRLFANGFDDTLISNNYFENVTGISIEVRDQISNDYNDVLVYNNSLINAGEIRLFNSQKINVSNNYMFGNSFGYEIPARLRSRNGATDNYASNNIMNSQQCFLMNTGNITSDNDVCIAKFDDRDVIFNEVIAGASFNYSRGVILASTDSSTFNNFVGNVTQISYDDTGENRIIEASSTGVVTFNNPIFNGGVIEDLTNTVVLNNPTYDFWAYPLNHTYYIGNGSSGNPYIVDDCNKLQNMRLNPTSYFNINQSIDCINNVWWDNGQGFIPINFSGFLDGQGNTINNLKILRSSTDNVGLFGILSLTISDFGNLKISNPTIQGNNNVGVLAGTLNLTAVRNLNRINLTDVNVSGSSSVGGLIGFNDVFHNTPSYNTYSTLSVDGGVVSGTSQVGGLIGYHTGNSNQDSQISQSYTNVLVNGSNNYVGGIVGRTHGGQHRIINSFTNSTVIGSNGVGGLIGYIHDLHAVSQLITNSLAYGLISGSTNVGGLTGLLTEQLAGNPYSVSNSFWDNETTNQSNSAVGSGGTKGTPIPTYLAVQQSTYTGWDFSTVWDIQENVTYPYLRSFDFTQSPNVTIPVELIPPNFTNFSLNITPNNVSINNNVNISFDFPSTNYNYTTNLSIFYPNGSLFNSLIDTDFTTVNVTNITGLWNVSLYSQADNNDWNNTTTGNFTSFCQEDWSCTAFSECVNGTQTRTCTDNNACGTNETKPTESQSCTVVTPSTTAEVLEQSFATLLIFLIWAFMTAISIYAKRGGWLILTAIFGIMFAISLDVNPVLKTVFAGLNLAFIFAGYQNINNKKF